MWKSSLFSDFMENEQKAEKKKNCRKISLQRIKNREDKGEKKKCLFVTNSIEYHFSTYATLKNSDICGEKVELIDSTL